MKLILKVFKFFFLVTFIGVCVYAYSRYVEPHLLIVKEHQIETNLVAAGDKIKIVQFSDTHLGEFYNLEQLEKLVLKINKQNPDLIVFTGDLIDVAHEYEDIHAISEVLKNLKAKFGKYAVWGNHDHGGGAANHYEDIMNEAGFVVLQNDVEMIQMTDQTTLNLAGLDEVMLGNPDPELIMSQLNPDQLNILILHEPDLIDDFYHSNVHLALAGHSHGGQINIPFIGPLVTTAYGEKYTHGMYVINENTNLKVYVNTGIGNTKLPYRFMNIPEISVFEILSNQ